MRFFYNNNEDITHDSESNNIMCDIPIAPRPSSLIIRQREPKRSRRREVKCSLPLHLSFSRLGDDSDIARFISRSTIHHRPLAIDTSKYDMDSNTPQSLPTSQTIVSSNIPLSISISQSVSDLEMSSLPNFPTESENEWTFITSHVHKDNNSTSYSRPSSPTTTTTTTSSTQWTKIDDS